MGIPASFNLYYGIDFKIKYRIKKRMKKNLPESVILIVMRDGRSMPMPARYGDAASVISPCGLGLVVTCVTVLTPVVHGRLSLENESCQQDAASNPCNVCGKSVSDGPPSNSCARGVAQDVKLLHPFKGATILVFKCYVCGRG